MATQLDCFSNRWNEFTNHSQSMRTCLSRHLLHILGAAASEMGTGKPFGKPSSTGDRSANYPQLPSATYKPHPDQTERLSVRLPQKHNSDILPSTILRSAWAMVLARYADTDDVIFGVTLAGRNVATKGMSHVLGPTITTVPLRIRIGQGQSVAEYLQAVLQWQAIEMMPFEQTGLQRIRNIGGNAKEAVGFRTRFLVQPALEAAVHSNFLDLEPAPITLEDFDTFALNIECRLQPNQVTIEARFDANVIPANQIRNMLHQFEHVTVQLASASGDLPVKEISLFGPQDEEQIGTLERKHTTCCRILCAGTLCSACSTTSRQTGYRSLGRQLHLWSTGRGLYQASSISN